MPAENTAHVHRCSGCGRDWNCSRPDCYAEDVCGSCEIEHFEQWAEAHALTTYQPALEPVSALLAKDDE